MTPVVGRIDSHATRWQRLGFDHTKQTFRILGRQFHLTDVKGELGMKMLA